MKEFLQQDRRWAKLAIELRRIGGEHTQVVPAEEPDLGFLIRNGHEILFKRLVYKRGESNACHQNASRLWADGIADGIGTGWALSKDGLWRQHSWGMRKDDILETTVKRERYWGVILEKSYALCFAGCQLPPEEHDRLLQKVKHA